MDCKLMEISLILSSIFFAGKSYHFVKYHVGNAALSKGYKCVSVEKKITNTSHHIQSIKPKIIVLDKFCLSKFWHFKLSQN